MATNTYISILRSAKERFWSRVDKFGGVPTSAPELGPCWLWTAGRQSAGYGVFYIESKPKYAHRLSYEAHNGPIPVGLQIDHLCRVRHCVNPSHLEAVTPSENARRGNTGKHLVVARKAKTHCPQGHPYSPENTILSKRGGRTCRTCNRAWTRRWRERTRGAK